MIDVLNKNYNNLISITVFKWIVLYISTFICQSLFALFNSRVDIIITKLLMKNLNKTIAGKYKKIEYKNYEDEYLHNIILRLGDNPHENIKNVFLSCLNSLNSLIVLIGLSFIFMQVSFVLTISLFAVLIGVLFFSTKGMNILNFAIRQQSKEERLLIYYNSLLFDKHSIFELTIFNAVEYVIQSRKSQENSLIKKLLKKSLEAGAIYDISTIMIIFWVIISLFYSGNMMSKDQISIGVFIAIVQSSITIIKKGRNIRV